MTCFHEVGLCVGFTGRAEADQIWAAILQEQNLWTSEKTEEPRPEKVLRQARLAGADWDAPASVQALFTLDFGVVIFMET
jgi:hypothetical protein